jgi:hypothetical protein
MNIFESVMDLQNLLEKIVLDFLKLSIRIDTIDEGLVLQEISNLGKLVDLEEGSHTIDDDPLEVLGGIRCTDPLFGLTGIHAASLTGPQNWIDMAIQKYNAVKEDPTTPNNMKYSISLIILYLILEKTGDLPKTDLVKNLWYTHMWDLNEKLKKKMAEK